MKLFNWDCDHLIGVKQLTYTTDTIVSYTHIFVLLYSVIISLSH